MDLGDVHACYRALRTRDARLDGRLFVGVASTGIYCRPICPARTPRVENCRFFPSAAAAQAAGFRPCRRCRPDSAPDLAAWRGTSNTVTRALALIARGDLDGDSGVEALADRLGVGGRQLRRLFRRHLGATPVAVAQTRRVLFARQLIDQTGLPMGDLALAAGFSSVRRFNEAFQDVFRCSPAALRRGAARQRSGVSNAQDGVTLHVAYQAPYDWEAMLAHLAARAVDGVEVVDAGCYRRTVSADGEPGTVEVTNDASRRRLSVRARVASVRSLHALFARVRDLFDARADVEAINADLGRDGLLAPLVGARPGLRVPGAWDGFELAVRAILGQQVTVPAARRLAGQLVALCGTPLPHDRACRGLSHAFPTPEQLAAADLRALAMPSGRRAALRTLAEAAIEDPHLFGRRTPDAVARLRRIPGVGEWTAQYIALRALGDADAFPAGDAGLARGAAAVLGARPTPSDLLRRADMWKPWRAYAAQHLWTVAAAGGRHTSGEGKHD